MLKRPCECRLERLLQPDAVAKLAIAMRPSMHRAATMDWVARLAIKCSDGGSDGRCGVGQAVAFDAWRQKHDTKEQR